MNDINENAAWHKVFTSGSEALKSKLKKVHAKNPKFQAFLKNIGHEGEQKSAAQAKKDVGQINKAKAKAAAPKPVGRTEVIKQIAQKLAARKQVAKHRAAWGGEVPGAEYDNPISMARAGHTIKGYRLGEEQTDEALLPKQEKIRKELIDKEMAEKRAKRQAGTAYGRYASMARKMRKMAEEVEQVDEVDYKKYLEVSQAKRPVKIGAVMAAKKAEREGDPNPIRKLANTQAAQRFARKQLAKKNPPKPSPSSNENPYGYGIPGKYHGDSVELNGPMIAEGKMKDIATDREETARLKAQEILGGPVKLKPKNVPAGKHPYGFRRARNLARARLKQLLAQRKGK